MSTETFLKQYHMGVGVTSLSVAMICLVAACVFAWRWYELHIYYYSGEEPAGSDGPDSYLTTPDKLCLYLGMGWSFASVGATNALNFLYRRGFLDFSQPGSIYDSAHMAFDIMAIAGALISIRALSRHLFGERAWASVLCLCSLVAVLNFITWNAR